MGSDVRYVIFNVDSGPGSTKERELAAVAAKVKAPLLAYVDTDYGSRSLDAVEIDLARYRRWYPIDGVFFDRAAATSGAFAATRRLVAAARSSGATTVVLNHGVYPEPEYATIADALVVFEGPASAHALVSAPDWVHGHPADTFWHLVYATPPAQVAEVRRRAARHHADAVYVTDRDGPNPWDGLPSYLPERVPE